MKEWMNEHDQTSLSHLITNLFSNWHKLFLTVLILTSLCVPSGLQSNSKYKLNFILERHWNFTEQLLLPNFSLVHSPLQCSAGFVSSTSNHPHNRGLEIKLELPRNGALITSFPHLPPPNPAGNNHLLCYRKIQGPLPISTFLDLSLTLSPFIWGQLCSRRCVRHILPGVNRPRRRAKENIDSYRAVYVAWRDQAPRHSGHGERHEPRTSPSAPWTQVSVGLIWSRPSCWDCLLGALSSRCMY